MADKTDRELLELAAKAAGINLRFLDGTIPFSSGPNRIGEWNPLTNDGDALRLAVKLRLHITMNAFGAAVSSPSFGVEESYPDVYAATRRAIVRAAAAIGEKL